MQINRRKIKGLSIQLNGLRHTLDYSVRSALPQLQHKAINHQRGVTLIELMVALVIGLVVSLAVATVLTSAEGRKRTTTSVNDIDKAGAFAAYQFNKVIASAGSGFTGGLNPNTGGKISSAQYSFGCQLTVVKGATLLPRSTAFSAPFNSVPQNLILAPIVILDGVAVGGDVIMSMAGSGGLAESITNLTAINTTGLEAETVASLTAGDKILLVQAGEGASAIPGGNCLLEQIDKDFVQGDGDIYDVPLAGDYHSGVPSEYNANSIVLNMGKLPQFALYGVGGNTTLFKYDLLEPAATGNNANPAPFIEGVFQMEAIYGITNPAGAVGNFSWQAPTGDYSSTNLLAGNATANSRLQNITMVRVAFIMRTNLSEKDEVSSGSVKIFEDVAGLSQTINNLDTNFRYRVIETTIPIRNAIMAMR